MVQRTGEDWTDVALTVSTARVARASDAPDVQPIKIDFWQPEQAEATTLGRVAKMDGLARAAPQSANAPPAAPAKPAIQAQEAATELQAGAYSAEFKVPGRITLGGDGAQKSFVLSRLNAEPTLLVKTAPAFDQTAYLQAHFVDSEDAPLLPGEVSLHREAAFVGQGHIGFVAPGDGVDLGFGGDDKIKIQRAPVNRKENEPTWFNQTKIETREFKTNIRNLHDFPVKVQVIDQIPISENTAITVEMLAATTPPTEKQVADKRGVMSWTYRSCSRRSQRHSSGLSAEMAGRPRSDDGRRPNRDQWTIRLPFSASSRALGAVPRGESESPPPPRRLGADV